MALFLSKKYFIYTALILVVAGMAACSRNDQKEQAAKHIADSIAACTPIKDPNNPKPMALMMRQMAANADTMRVQLLNGGTLDSLEFPFLRFYMVEPTDPKVLQPQFYENARLFQEAYKAMFRANKADQVTAFNATISMCVNCHESYCNGPLKRIRKLPILQ